MDSRSVGNSSLADATAQVKMAVMPLLDRKRGILLGIASDFEQVVVHGRRGRTRRTRGCGTILLEIVGLIKYITRDEAEKADKRPCAE